MEFLDFDEDIMVPQEIAVEYGGNYNILESIWAGGIGSPPVYYKEGIEFFDEYLSSSPHKPTRKTTFALMKKGLIIRLNNLSKIKGCILHFGIIERVTIKKYPKSIFVLQSDLQEDGILSEGQLIIEMNNFSYIFEIPEIHFYKLEKFFQKKQFEPQVTKS